MLAIGGTVLVVGTIVGVAMNAASPERKARAAAKPQVEAILTDEDPPRVGLGLDRQPTATAPGAAKPP